VISYQFELKGDQAVTKALSEANEGVLSSLRLATNFLRKLTVLRTPWVTGRTAGAWSDVEPNSGGYSFGNPLPHTQGLEIGFEKVKNPKQTVSMGGRYYSKQAPSGIIKPLLDNPEIMNQAIMIFLNGLERSLNAGT
jgi:hypothetical protein